MKKAEIYGRLRAQKCPERAHKIFQLRELAKVSQAGNLSKLSAFFRFCPERYALSPHLRQAKVQNLRTCFRLFNCQISSKTKEAATFPVLQENFRVTAPKTILGSFNPLIFRVSGAETNAAPAFLNPGLQTV